MLISQIFTALSLIPLCSLLNHLGGQSKRIPCPRVTCRMFGIGIAFGIVSLLCGLGNANAAINGGIGIAGMTFWAVWSNGSEFMVYNKTDFRRYGQPWYTPTRYITALCDFSMNVSQLTKLTPAQCVEWGTIYGTILGLFLYPMFSALGIQVTPWAFSIGLFCLAQGEVYRSCSEVPNAEYVWGGFIGMALAAVLILHIVIS